MKTKLSEITPAKHPRVIISFGGGMGGCHHDYGVCSKVVVEGTKITFEGYKLPVCKGNQWVFRNDTEGKKLLVFQTGYWPQHRIDNLLRCLRGGNLAEALIEYTATDPKNKPMILPLETVTAVGNWVLSR